VCAFRTCDDSVVFCGDCSGYVTFEEFLAALDLPRTPITEQVFHLFDKQGHGSINFREVWK
jgi:Ca2+-binding EF-hand superfamily protein